MAATEALLEAANYRLQGPLEACDLDDPDRMKRGISCGFRYEGQVYVGYLTWKKVKYAGKVSYHFNLSISSLDGKETHKVPLARVVPGGFGRVRLISLPKLNLEVTRDFRQEVE
jgi:hypothetical protein